MTWIKKGASIILIYKHVSAPTHVIGSSCESLHFSIEVIGEKMDKKRVVRMNLNLPNECGSKIVDKQANMEVACNGVLEGRINLHHVFLSMNSFCASPLGSYAW